jgi:hypothetical protein
LGPAELQESLTESVDTDKQATQRTAFDRISAKGSQHPPQPKNKKGAASNETAPDFG